MTAGILAVRTSSLIGNRAVNGGAVSVKGGEASFDDCRLAENVAEQNGGALHASGGSVTLRQGTQLEDNAAAGSGTRSS